MAREKGTANLAASLEVLAGAPLDARDVCPTVADLYVAANWPYKYIGMKTVVTATGETYRLVNLDVTQESSWVLDGVPTIGIGGGFAPIGTIISYMGTTAPQDYLICDGTTYNIADYKQLADFFAAQFGSSNFFGGDGVTTFKVPDLRGEFLRGTGTNTHTDQGDGSNVGAHQDSTQFPANMFGISGGNANKIEMRGIGDSSGNVAVKNADTSIPATSLSNVKKFLSKDGDVTDITSGNIYATIRPTNTSVLYCIKAVVAGDVYSTDERVVGTWIDGKPLYQKTIVDTMPTITVEDTSVEKDIPIGASVEYGHIITANFNNSGTFVTLNCSRSDISNMVNNAFIYLKVNTHTQVEKRNMITVGGTRTGFSEKPLYITIQYTKTTD